MAERELKKNPQWWVTMDKGEVDVALMARACSQFPEMGSCIDIWVDDHGNATLVFELHDEETK